MKQFIPRLFNLKQSYRQHLYHHGIGIEERFWPTDESISAEKRLKPSFGAHGAEETPVLIPNTEVKLSSGDYTATSGKLARCRIIKRTSE
jgi:hypothetical protein